MNNNEVIISIRNLKKEYENITPIKNISTDIHKGDIISIIGPSGCGKSTFLRMINMLEKPTSGDVIVDGTDITKNNVHIEKIRAKMGMVFQSYNLFSHMTVIENVMYALIRIKNFDKQKAYDIAIEKLKQVGMSEKKLSYPDDLSGGQKQRVAIARALAMEPEIILFDEPTSALDPMMVNEVMRVIKSLAEKHYTMMIVTHEMKFAKSIANRVFFLDEGTIYEEGTPEEIFENPKKEKTKIFINKLKVFERQITKENFDLYKLFEELDTFLNKNYIEHIRINDIQLILEEIIVETIFKNIESDVTLLLKISYKEKKEKDKLGFHINIKNENMQYNPLTQISEMSKSLILAKIKDLSNMTYNEEENTLRIKI